MTSGRKVIDERKIKINTLIKIGMELKSKRLKLKEVTWNDAEEVHSLFSIPEVDEFNTLGIPRNIEETKEIIRPMIEAQNSEIRKSCFWKIVKKDSEEFIGVAGMILSADKFKLGEICYKLLPSQWGQGYATEVAKTLMKSGFDDFHLHKVEAGVATENIRSIRVLEKSGMTRESLRRKILPIRGEWKDNYHYAIVEDDPRDY
jgi:[ribosomal protein S5]-alanine N-acetyltransferase